MAFPQVAQVTTSLEDAGNVTSHTVDLPSGIVSGELLIVIFGNDGNSVPSTPTGWSTFPAVSFGLAQSDAMHLQGFWRVADGSEGATLTVTTGSSERSAHISMRIQGHDASTTSPDADGGTIASNDSPNPGNSTPAYGTEDTLWIACCGNDRDRTITAYPSSYPDNRTNSVGGGANSCGVGIATLELNASSDDPEVFTISANDQWRACTVMIAPGSEGLPTPMDSWFVPASEPVLEADEAVAYGQVAGLQDDS